MVENPPCSWCEQPSHIRQGRILLCAKHYRVSSMRANAKRNGKETPTREQIESMIPTPFVCSCCHRPMTWLRELGTSQQATLQHDRNGEMRIICFACNTRHAHHPGDSFYGVPASHKRCPDCETNKPLDAFAVDRSRPIGRKSYCRQCAALRFKKWEARHAA